MPITTTRDTFRDIVARQLSKHPEEITDQSKFLLLGADDLDMIEMEMEAEEAFALDLTGLDECVTFGDAAILIEKQASIDPDHAK